MTVLYEEVQLLSFISNEKLFHAVEKIITKAKKSKREDKDIYKNAIDPFSALFDASLAGISLKDWLEVERTRQVQKSLQNTIGEFHEEIIGSMPGWERLLVGHIIDVVNPEKKIIAELKNKWNTTKGSDKVVLYNSLSMELKSEQYSGYTGYYVEVIPEKGKTYDKPFMPSDHTKHIRKPENQRIRIIDGKSFYALASGDPLALQKLYKILPRVIAEIENSPSIADYSSEELFHILFGKAYSPDYR